MRRSCWWGVQEVLLLVPKANLDSAFQEVVNIGTGRQWTDMPGFFDHWRLDAALEGSAGLLLSLDGLGEWIL